MPEILQQTTTHWTAHWSQIYADSNLEIEVYIPSADRFDRNNTPDALETQLRVTSRGSQISLSSLTLVAALHRDRRPPGFEVTLDQNQNNFSPTSSAKDFTVNQTAAPGAPWVSDPFRTWVKRLYDGAEVHLGFYIRSLNYSISKNQLEDPHPDSSTTILY
jgi:hypothetical protein